MKQGQQNINNCWKLKIHYTGVYLYMLEHFHNLKKIGNKEMFLF